MKRWIIGSAALAALALPPTLVAQPLPRQDERRDERQDLRNVELPRAAEQAIHRRYPNAQIQVLAVRTDRGVRNYKLKITTDQGESGARVTEAGDILYLGYPGASVQTLPDPVNSVLQGLFNQQPSIVHKYETTNYLIDASIGRRDYRLIFNAAGALEDIRPMTEARDADFTRFPRATRSEEESLLPRLNDYFTNPRVQTVYRHPDYEGYYWVDLSTATEPDVKILMNARAEIDQYRMRLDPNNLPQPIRDRLGELFRDARATQAYRNQYLHYNIVQPTAGDDKLFLSITPTGNVLRVRPAGQGDLEAFREEEEPRRDGFRLD